MVELTKNGDQQSVSSIHQKLFELGKRLLAEVNINRLLQLAMDAAIEISNAERGLIILFDDKGNTSFQTARSLNQGDIEHPQFEISRTIIDRVRTGKLPIYLPNALDDPEFKLTESVDRLRILSVICTPLQSNDDVFGVVYLDHRKLRGAFKPETYAFVREFANFISLSAFKELERKRLHRKVNALEKELRAKYQFESIVGQHPKMLDVLELVSQVAASDATVLIQGESGTGKELIARALHHNSLRDEQSFTTVNCAALPEQLLESELFGHVRGAFTGAIKDRSGWFERADGGTIFLDEINDMNQTSQIRLLRVLQTGEYSPVGSSLVKKCDVRIIAASNRNLLDLVHDEKFREDLYYRLNVIDIWLPPLRERRSDIPLLIQNFIQKYGTEYGKPNLNLTAETESLLLAYNYPGNVRELENMIQRAVILSKDGNIELQHLPEFIVRGAEPKSSNKTFTPFKLAKQNAVESFERQYIIDCLQITKGYVRRAAKMAGIHVKNFHEKMKKYHINPIKFRDTSE
ncbi:sigma 54-interacting transcriptional regulator [candidate division KSB1 bacterium]|nr:sigma 54-interacting transcriptional regulator [candidate division KSB1 bacterium]